MQCAINLQLMSQVIIFILIDYSRTITAYGDRGRLLGQVGGVLYHEAILYRHGQGDPADLGR